MSIVGIGVLLLLLANMDGRGADARGYWSFDPAHPYVEAMDNLSATVAFRYAPPVALLLTPFHALSWPVFLVLWNVLLLAALAWSCRGWTLAALALYPVALELSTGNVHLLLAFALVIGLRYPAAWSLLALTKVTTAVCWLWYPARGEWRSFAVVVGTTAALSALSYLVAPDLWRQWFAMLASDVGATAGLAIPIPLAVRLPLAAVIVVWGARTDRPWTLAIALLLSIPTIWPHAFSVLVALIALERDEVAGWIRRPGSSADPGSSMPSVAPPASGWSSVRGG